MSKRAKNLLLDADVLALADAYCRAHGVTLSAVIEEFLRTVPLGGQHQIKSAVVAEMVGVANYGPLERETYRDFLTWYEREKPRKRR